MPGFAFTSAALSDLKSIARYTQTTWGEQQRDQYLLMLDKAFHLLAFDPKKGRECENIRPFYRKYMVGKHIIFYRIIEDHFIEVVRILHERMDVRNYLPD